VGVPSRALWQHGVSPVPLRPEDLCQTVGDGTVDTVLLAMCDMQGRLQGKRLGA